MYIRIVMVEISLLNGKTGKDRTEYLESRHMQRDMNNSKRYQLKGP